MTEPTDASINPSALFDTWMKSVNDFWSGMAPSSLLHDEENTTTEETAKKATSWFTDWDTALGYWQTLASTLGSATPSSVGFQGLTMFPETFLKMTEPVFTTVNQMLHQWQNQLHRSAEYVTPLDFDTLETDVLKVWENIYDKELRKFFKTPQLGLTREHQEKVVRFLDRYHLLHSALAEFISFLAIPFKNTYTDFQEKLTRLSRDNDLPREINDYYRIWLKILEGHYMTLFQSPDYIRVLTKALTASAAYTQAKKELVNDLLRQFSIPSSEHMDAVYHELHSLKKRLKDLEKAVTHR